jgi:hypothetical protein
MKHSSVRLSQLTMMVALVAMAGLAAPAEMGTAAVTLTVDGRAIQLTHAYARLEMSLESQAEPVVLLTAEPVPQELLDRGYSLRDILANSGAVHGLYFRLPPQGRAESWKVVHPDLDTGCAICSDWVAQATRGDGSIRGRVFTESVQTTDGKHWEFKGEFQAPLLPSWEMAAEAKATPGQKEIRKKLREDGHHFSPEDFFLAAMMNPADVVRYLDAGMPPDTPDPDSGDTILFSLLGGDQPDPEAVTAVLALIRRGADVNRVSRKGGDTPLARAFCCADVVRALLGAGARLDGPSGQSGRTAAQALVDLAVTFHHPEVIRLVMARGHSLGAEREDLLERAAGQPELIAALGGKAPPAEMPPGPAAQPTGSAARPPAEAPPARRALSRTEAFERLKARGTPFTSDAFWGAMMDHDAETVLLFLDAGMTPNQAREGIGDTPLLFASTWNYGTDTADKTAIILGLIAHGADVNYADINNAPPLLHAAEYCPVEVVRALLKAGAKTAVKAKGGATPMMMAVIFGRADNVQALIEGGYDVKAELNSLLPIAGAHPEIKDMLTAAAK